MEFRGPSFCQAEFLFSLAMVVFPTQLLSHVDFITLKQFQDPFGITCLDKWSDNFCLYEALFCFTFQQD
jgi:hypothetical protein